MKHRMLWALNAVMVVYLISLFRVEEGHFFAVPAQLWIGWVTFRYFLTGHDPFEEDEE